MHEAGCRPAWGLTLLLASVLFAPFVAAESAVTIDFVTALEETDLGIESLAFDGHGSILAVGADGYIGWIDSTTPTTNQRLESNRTETLNAVSFHPAGNALMVGDSGVILRYIGLNRTVEPAGGTTAVERSRLTAVAWNTAGSWAYIGGESGWIWRYRGGEDGSAEMHRLDGLRDSDVTAISCHAETPLCVVVTEADGIGIIDRDHNLSWIGGSGTIWSDVACTAKSLPRCVAVGNGRQLALISLQEAAPAESDAGMARYTDVAGEFRSICGQDETRILVATTPFSLIEYDVYQDTLYPWLNQSDAVTAGPVVAGSTIVCTWAEDADTGHILTARGDIVQFHPPAAEDGLTSNLLYIVVSVVIIICVPGVILGLTYMNSTRMQSAYLGWRRKRREKTRGSVDDPSASRRKRG